ncbi:MAG: sugar phosphate isomerase/epimerase, partial [Armatimonadetes bacterium]|nr:sugar phosphate isomerase/epimerase [Armatimonadota bacterium]
MPVSITTDYHVDPDTPRVDQCRRMAHAGFRYLHWCWDWSENVVYGEEGIEKARAEIAAGGLELIDTHGSEDGSARVWDSDAEVRARGLRLHEDRIRFTAALGGDTVVLHPPSTEQLQEGLPRLLDAIRSLEPLCQRTGVRLAIENMANSEINRRVLSAAFEAFEPKLVGFTFDCGHANIAGDTDWLIANCLDRLMALHLHDNDGQGDLHQIPG